MSIDASRNYQFTMPMRGIFGLVAIATLLSNSPWNQPAPLAAITAYAGSIMWGVMAVFGNKIGWQRRLILAIAVVYLILVVSRLLGVAA